MTALDCCLQHWADDTSLGPQLLLLHGPFPPCTRHISSIQPPGLLFCPSSMTTPPFLIFLFIFSYLIYLLQDSADLKLPRHYMKNKKPTSHGICLSWFPFPFMTPPRQDFAVILPWHRKVTDICHQHHTDDKDLT